MIKQELTCAGLPAALYGAPAERVWLYLHGKGGCKEEAEAFAQTACPRGWQVLAVDLPEHGARRGGAAACVPWTAVPELEQLLQCAGTRWSRIALRCTSLGAWFALLAFQDIRLDRALFVSPVLDMEQLIRDMMAAAQVDEARLEAEREIPTDFGETLSWRYLQYVREHPVTGWNTPTAILYGGQDALVRRESVEAFSRRFRCTLTVLEQSGHWLHTQEQLAALRLWEEKEIGRKVQW